MSCAGLCIPARARSCSALWIPGPPSCWDPPSVTRMWDMEQETHCFFFFQATTPSLDPWVSWVSLCPPSPSWLSGTVSAREQPPSQLGPSSQGPGSGIWDGVGTGALPQGVLRGEGSTEAETHDTDPRNGWWLFFSRLLSLTRSSSGGRGELSSTTPHSGKRYEKYKNKEAYI